MPRVRRGSKKKDRRVEIMKLAKGNWGAKSHNYRTAKEAVEKGLLYSYRDRRQRRRDFRGLWIIRIRAAAIINGISYSRLMDGLHKLHVELDRKVLADLAVNAPKAFAEIAQKAKDAVVH